MTYQLSVEPLGETIPIEEGQTVLDACLRNGIYLPYQCNHGLCSTCKVSVLDGEVDHDGASPFALMDFEREEGKALACCARALSDITIEADIDVDPEALNLPVQDLVATVAEIRTLTRDIRGIWLDLPGEGLRFQAGQYVNLRIPGCDEPRSFSIASPPSQPNRIELHVRLVPGGVGTRWLHEQLQIGDRIELTGPLGRFFVRTRASEPMIFLAGGSGLSSPKSMVLERLGAGCSTPITLIHGVRTRADLYDDALFRELAAAHPNFTYIPVLSEHQPEDAWDGATGFVHEEAERHFEGLFKGHKAYLCGPPPMIDACVRSLMKGRLFEKDIYLESFLTKADAGSLAKSPLYKRI